MASPVSVLIVEDKVIIAESLAETLTAAGYAITKTVSTGEAAIEEVRSNPPDVIVMDIHLAGTLDGIQTSEQINREHSIPIIYLTDFHDRKTIERAAHTQPAAFLPKPFKARELLTTITFAFYNASNKRTAVPGRNEEVAETIFPFRDRIMVKDNDALLRVDIGDILWIKAGGPYCEIHTTGKMILLTSNLGAFLQKFNHPHLMRVHRSYAVNMDKVTAMRGNMLLIGEIEVPVSDGHRDEVHRRFAMI